MELLETPNSPVTPGASAADEGTRKDSVRASKDVMPTPDSKSQNIQESPDKDSTLLSFDIPDISSQDIIRLLGERLVVDLSKRKVGEVIVRKEIEIRIVQVPVRREKLIVEQVSPERKQLAEIDLGQQEIAGIELPIATNLDKVLTVSSEFDSPKISSLLLNALARERRHGCKKVQVEIIVEDAERQKTYQEWFDRCSDSQTSQSE